jgi:hypothetical protein
MFMESAVFIKNVQCMLCIHMSHEVAIRLR